MVQGNVMGPIVDIQLIDLMQHPMLVITSSAVCIVLILNM